MKNKPNKISKLFLDDYEKELEEFLNRGEYVSAGNLEETKEMFQNAIWIQKELQKTKRVTLRVKNLDLILVKAKAKKSGIPYQRLINALIHQYAEGKAKIAF